MTDIIDIAQQRQLEQVKIQPRDYTALSLAECEQCGNDIPPQRQAYCGITLCIECASAKEAKARTFR
ncbi:conjugal transfer protein TraR [Acinetobacter populi]|uniref:Conjugal transfer protein TraR n=1 Tax=Acinetobacter populi TaxID=1582270 RepID=A0A1Z9Z2N4_9GAMM|nr:conjugal transfer protein TraR [Acinetobacter populi]OUY08720.1 conjugal transfer protein TraR [Acinetobacter populi]